MSRIVVTPFWKNLRESDARQRNTFHCRLKQTPGKGLLVGGVKLPLALAEPGLIDEYEFVVQPRVAGHGPTFFAGLSKPVDLRLVSRLEFAR
jgi:dihydrofolate reductase